MPLSNTRWEKFAQRVASGDSATRAYRTVYKVGDKSAESHGCRLVRNGKVAARIEELQCVAASAVVMSLREKREFLALLVRTPIGEAAGLSPWCGRQQGANDKTTALHVRMLDKLKAIELDARLAGELKGNGTTVDVTAVTGAGGFVLTEERRAELMERKRAAMERQLSRNGR